MTESTTTIPIPSLDPSSPTPSNSQITATISLIWPFSSLTDSTSLLLSATDYRLRHHKGQVRVVFAGRVGRAVAGARLGIGDQVSLALEHGQWQDEVKAPGAILGTPGRSVGTLKFERGVGLEVFKEGRSRRVEVREVQMERAAVPETPVRKVRKAEREDEDVHPSPAFMRGLRGHEGTAGVVGLDYDDLDEGRGKRRRVSYKGVREWRFSREESGVGQHAQEEAQEDGLDRGRMAPQMSSPPLSSLQTSVSQGEEMQDVGTSEQPVAISSSESSQVDTAAQEIRQADSQSAMPATDLPEVMLQQSQESMTALENAASTVPTMLPPPLPRLQMPGVVNGNDLKVIIGPETPRLIPVSPGGLPIMSPFPQTPISTVVPFATMVDSQEPNKDDHETIPQEQPSLDYFDSSAPPPKTPLKVTDDSGSGQLSDHLTIPLAEVMQESSSLEGLPDAAVSPSSGSEADISSDDDYDVDEITRLQDESEASDDLDSRSMLDMNDPQLLDEIDEQELLYKEDDDVLAEKDDMDEFEHESDGLVSASMSVKSDDEGDQILTQIQEDEDAVTVQESRSIMFPDEMDSEDEEDDEDDASAGRRSVDMLDESELQGSASYDFGLDGASQSKPRVLSVPDVAVHMEQDKASTASGDESGQASAGAESLHSSQEEEAAWAALDEAVEAVKHTEDRIDATKAQIREDRLSLGGPSRRPQDDGAAQESSVNESFERRMQAFENKIAPLSSLESIDQSHVESARIQPARSHTASQVDPDATIPDSEPISISTNDAELLAHKSQTPVSDTAADPEITQQKESANDVAQGIDEANKISSPKDDKVQNDGFTAQPVAEHSLSMSDTAAQMKFPEEQVVGGAARFQEEKKGEEESEVTPAKVPDTSHEQVEVPMEQLKKDPYRRRSAREVLLERRASSRLSLNSDALAEYFTPTDSSATSRRKTIASFQERTAPQKPKVQQSSQREVSPPPLRRLEQSTGTTTSLSYFTPLTNLEGLTNDTTTPVDVLAVVTKKTSEVVRAKNGPRDWFVVFHITDPDLSSQSQDSIRVEIYRPWKASLPIADVGDVVLLRSFTVRSKERKIYLLSTEASAWAVWRSETDKEEVRGPPVDYGDDERNKAAELRTWWSDHLRN